MSTAGEVGAILFDMDGLMVDSEPIWLRVEQDFLAARGVTWTEADAAACIGGGLHATVRLMIARFGLEIGIEAGVAELVSGFQRRLGELALKPGCAELVAAARAAGLPIAVASSNRRVLVAAVLAHVGLGDAFGAIVTGDDVARAKPAPDIFLEAARRLDIQPELCIVLEDAPKGMQAGKAAGMRVIGVPDADRTGPFDADWVVDDLFAAATILGIPQEGLAEPGCPADAITQEGLGAGRPQRPPGRSPAGAEAALRNSISLSPRRRRRARRARGRRGRAGRAWRRRCGPCRGGQPYAPRCRRARASPGRRGCRRARRR